MSAGSVALLCVFLMVCVCAVPFFWVMCGSSNSRLITYTNVHASPAHRLACSAVQCHVEKIRVCICRVVYSCSVLL